MMVYKATPKEIEKTKKEVSKIFKSNGLKIAIDANKKIVQILDLTFDCTDIHEAQQQISYVHRQSNHPQHYLKTYHSASTKGLLTFHPAKKFLTNQYPLTSKHSKKGDMSTY